MLAPRIDHGPPTTEQWTTLHILALLIPLALYAVIGGLYLWRLHHFPHAVATIEAVWDVEIRTRNGPTLITMAELTFTRTTRSGEAIPCRYSFEIGKPADGFQAGEKLEIVPATGTCQRANILGRSKPRS